jgi:hypothetical protein
MKSLMPMPPISTYPDTRIRSAGKPAAVKAVCCGAQFDKVSYHVTSKAHSSNLCCFQQPGLGQVKKIVPNRSQLSVFWLNEASFKIP